MQSSSQALAHLLLTLFTSAAQQRKFVRSLATTEMLDNGLPGDAISAEQMADALVRRLLEHGLLDAEFFQALAEARPRRIAEIRAVALRFNVSPPDITTDPASPGLQHSSVSRRRTLGGIALGLMATTLLTATNLESRDVGASKGSILPLSPDEADPMILHLVSRRSGRGWSVAVSRHREVSSAAAAMFFKFLFAGALDSPEAQSYLEGASFTLCQNDTCYHHNDLIEEAVKPGVDVWIAFSVRETAALDGPVPETPMFAPLAEFDLRSYDINMVRLCTPSNGCLRFLRQLPPPP